MGEKMPRLLPKVATSTSLLGSFTYRKFTTWDSVVDYYAIKLHSQIQVHSLAPLKHFIHDNRTFHYPTTVSCKIRLIA